MTSEWESEYTPREHGEAAGYLTPRRLVRIQADP